VSELRCPVDGLALSKEVGTAEDGVLCCGTHRYPVSSGIPVLLDSPAARAALEAIDAGEPARARAALLTPDRWGRADTVARGLDRILGGDRFARRLRSGRVKRFLRWHGEGSFPSYRAALDAFLSAPPDPQPESLHYFFSRPSDPTFVVAEAVTSGVARRGTVLDLCCGSGFVTRLVSRGRSEAVTGLDESFPLLFLAKSFLAPRARYVCARADRPLPFADRSFDAVVCSDALHDTEDPAEAAREMLRVRRDGGGLFAIHLHNPAFEHAYPGRNPLPPRGYASLFEGADPRLLDEGPILDAWVDRGEVDFSAIAAPEALSGARTLTLLAGDGAPRGTARPEPPAPECIALSPLYRGHRDGETLRLGRVWPSAFWHREYPDAERYLPEGATLGSEALEGLRGNRLEAEAVDLFRRRVLIDVPAAYGAERPWEGP